MVSKVNWDRIKRVIKTGLRRKKTAGPDAFSGEFKQVFKKRISLLHKLFRKIEGMEILPNQLYEANVTLMLKPVKKITKKAKKIAGHCPS